MRPTGQLQSGGVGMKTAARCRLLCWPVRYRSWGYRAQQSQLPASQAYTSTQSFHLSALQRQEQQQQQGTVKQLLSWQELHRAAQIAAWSGLCYQLPQDLQTRIDQQHLQLTLVGHGRNEYTAWYVADGIVPHAHFCTTVRQRSTAASSGNKGSSRSSIGSTPAAAAGEDADVCEVPHGTRERFVFMRGVQWSAHDVDSVKLSQALMRMWPTPFPRTATAANTPIKARAASSTPGNSSPGSSSSTSTSSGGSSSHRAAAAAAAAAAADGAAAAGVSPLVAHEGVAEVAGGLFDQLRPFLDQADDVGMPICFAGHSLGGSLAMLTMVLYQLNSRRRQPGTVPSCYTFGSPPVLAHETGGGGHRVLAALGLPPSCVKNFVLENDPVPRALLSVDPTFELLKGWGAVQGLLQLRGLLAGEGSPLSPNRFLFESVGQVHLIKWTQEGGSEVVPLDAHELETELSLLGPRPGAHPPAAGSSSNTSSTATSASSSSAAAAAAGDAVDAAGGSPAAEAGGGGLSGMAAALSQFMSPLRGVQAWLDHHHGSYAQELEAATLRGIKQQVAQQGVRR